MTSTPGAQPPADGILGLLTAVDSHLQEIRDRGSSLPLLNTAQAGVAQVIATCALVHAVRELTEEVRAARRRR